jgi:hypothetical protein
MLSSNHRLGRAAVLVCFGAVFQGSSDTDYGEREGQGVHLQSVRHEGILMNVLIRRMSPFRLTLVVAVGAMAGCGAEVAGTAATSAKLQATQAEQAKAQEAQFKKKLGEAMQATEAAASAAGNQ